MKPIEYIRVAIDALTQNKVRSALTMLGVIIGVAAVILLVSLGEAARRYVETEFAGLGSNLLRVTPGKQEEGRMAPVLGGSFRKLTRLNADQIRSRTKAVNGVAPMVMGSGSIRFDDRQRNSMVIGVDEGYTKVRGVDAAIGRFITDQDDEKNNAVCVIGTRIREELFGGGNALNERISINRRKFTIVGILEPLGLSLGLDMDDLVYIPLRASQQMFFGGEDEVLQILISVRNVEEIDAVKEQVKEVLIAAHDYTEDFSIIDQRSILSTFGRIFEALKFMLVGLASISLLVGGIGIMNIMLVSVRERTREVGIRKAVGARRRDIGIQFLVESTALSVTGGVIGIFLGYLGTIAARTFYPTLPVYPSLWATVLAFAFSLSVGVFFGVYPALKATAVDPVEALRYE